MPSWAILTADAMESTLKRSSQFLWSLLWLPTIACSTHEAQAANSAVRSPASTPAVKTQPVSAYEKGAAAFARKDYVSALSNFEVALGEHPNDPTVHYGLASVFMSVGNAFQAKCFYQSCISLAPQSKLAENARAGLAYLDKPSTAASINAGDVSKAGSADSSRFKPAQSPQSALIPPLPAPTPGRYSAPDPQPQPGFSSGGSGYPFGGGRGRRGQYGYQSYGYYYATPHMQVRNYSFPPSSTTATSSEPSQVELLAKQSKLVVDEKSSR